MTQENAGQFHLFAPALCWPALKEGPSYARTNTTKLDAAPLKQADGQQRCEKSWRHTRCGISPDDAVNIPPHGNVFMGHSP